LKRYLTFIVEGERQVSKGQREAYSEKTREWKDEGQDAILVDFQKRRGYGEGQRV
jgi:hypothetical protein